MKLSYTLTLADYKAAIDLHCEQTLLRRIGFVFWYRAIPAATLAGLTVLTFLWSRPHSKYIAGLAGVDGMLVWLSVYLPVVRYYQTRKGFKRLFPLKRTDLSSSIDIDDERVVSGIPGISEAKLFWDAFTGFAQNETVTMLYISKKTFLFFPTSALSVGQRAELAVLVGRHIEKS